MLFPTRRLWRLALIAPLLLLLLLSSSQPQTVFASESSLPSQFTELDGDLRLRIWQQALGFDGYNWTQIYTEEVSVTMWLNSRGEGFNDHVYSYTSVLEGRTDDVWYGECGWVANWDIWVDVSPPPDCTASIILTESWLPGFCWGCVQFFGCYAELTEGDDPLEMEFNFKIGDVIFLTRGWDHPSFEGYTYVLLEDAYVFNGQCQHEAFSTP